MDGSDDRSTLVDITDLDSLDVWGPDVRARVLVGANASLAVVELAPDALVYEIDEAETGRLRKRLAAKDARSRGLGAHEVHPLGERLIQRR